MESPSPPRGIPERIGPYRILREIASGGMGTVYEAEQENPRRPVALKVMRMGLGSAEVQRRFEYESQILARLRHPGIAQIYEAGTYREGTLTLPYFAMEYVAGALAITDYADSKGLDRRARIALFMKVLAAVHHGHAKGVIHRDLKPANLLVDPQGEVKVIDFGVARLSDSERETQTLLTRVGQLIGTVQYMSPEQVEADPDRIDTRSDVYSLGVVLYELLTERLPHDFTSVSVDQATRMIREEPPTRLSSFDRSLRGDLETVVLKALEKDRERRYQSAEELRSDLGAFLTGTAISARPASAAYQLQVLARRHRALVGGVLAVFVVLLAGIAVSGSMYLRAESLRVEADEQAGIAREVNRFLNEDLLAAVDPRNTARREITMREVLDQASERIGDRFTGRPLVEAALRGTIGATYVSLGRSDQAEPHLERAHELLLRERGPLDPETLTAEHALAALRYHQGRVEEAERALLAVRGRVLEVHGPESDEALRTAGDLAMLYVDLRRLAEAEELLEETVAVRRRVNGEVHEETLRAVNNLAMLYGDSDRLVEAEALYRSSLERAREHLGADHPSTLTIQNNLVWLLVLMERYPEAVELGQATLEDMRRVLGGEHAETMSTANNLAVAYKRQGRLDLAEPLYLEDLRVSERTLGESHPDVLISYANVGALYCTMGRFEEAREVLERCLALSREALPADYYGTGFTLCALGEARLGLGLVDEAEEALLEGYDILEAAFGRGHPNFRRAVDLLVRVYVESDRPEEAKLLLEASAP